MRHDRWSELGEKNLGEHNIRWAEGNPLGVEEGMFTLTKCILNDHWADNHVDVGGWDREHVDYVMSKLYYCWCRILFEKHPVTEQEEWVDAKEEDEEE